MTTWMGSYNSLNLHFTMGNDVVLNNGGLDSDSDAAGNAAVLSNRSLD